MAKSIERSVQVSCDRSTRDAQDLGGLPSVQASEDPQGHYLALTERQARYGSDDIGLIAWIQ
jgi:hypothetical protein